MRGEGGKGVKRRGEGGEVMNDEREEQRKG